MLTITFVPNTPGQAELIGQFLKTYMADPAQEPVALPVETITTPIEAKKPRAAAKPTPVVEIAPEVAPVGVPEVAPETAPVVVTLVEVRAKLAALGLEGKAEAVRALLAARGVEKLSKIPTEQLADVLAEAEAL